MKWLSADVLNGFGLPIAFIQLGDEGYMVNGAESFCRLIGETYDPDRAYRLREFIPPENQERFDALWSTVILGEAVHRREIVLLTSRGIQHTFIISMIRRETKPDEPPDICCALHDLDFQKELVFALEAAEERFNVVLRESSDPILTISAEGELLSANPAFEELTGLTAGEFLRNEKGWLDFMYEPDIQRVRGAIEQKLNGRDMPSIEFRMYDRHGRLGFYEQSLSELHDESGGLRGLLAIIRNITRRKERERELMEHAEAMQQQTEQVQTFNRRLKRYFMELNNLPKELDGFLEGVCRIFQIMYDARFVLIVLTENGRVIRQARETLSGELINQHAGQLLCKACRRVLEEQNPLYRIVPDKSDPLCETGCLHEPGVSAYVGAPLRDSSGKIHGVIAVASDQRRRMDSFDIEVLTVAGIHVAARLVREEQEQAQRELEHHMRQMQKMEAVGMLAGGIAHDFNNHLSSILGFSSFIKRQTDEHSPFYNDICLIEKSARSAADLTRQLLAFARDRDFEREAVYINDVVAGALDLLKRTLPKNIDIQTYLPNDLPPLLGEKSQIDQVLMNLCINAGDAMRETGGTLTIRTVCRKLTPYERQVMVDLRDREYLCLSVRDTGPGISEDAQKRVFDPFYTTKKDRGGSGLGLSIVYGIVINHGGSILLESRPGRGTEFRVFFPVSEVAARKERNEEIEAVEGQGEHILVVEDEEFVRRMISDILRRSGYTVSSVRSGREALDFYREHHEEVDLVFLDLIMPDMDGVETFKQLKQINSNARVLLTSGYAKVGQAEEMLKAGAAGLVHKPYVSDTLLHQIRRAL